MNYHQGDILLQKRESPIPVTAKKTRDEIAAYGEATGHTHRVAGAQIYRDDDGREFVRVIASAPMTHDEHPATAAVEPGDYDLIRQYEYFPEGDIAVAD